MFKCSVRNRNEYNDYDYLHKLSAKDRDWLNRFHREWLNADFKHSGKSVLKKKDRTVCYQMNNCRNRDLYCLLKVTGRLRSLTETHEQLDNVIVKLYLKQLGQT